MIYLFRGGGNIYCHRITETQKTSVPQASVASIFYADFIVFDKVIVEIKAREGGIAEKDYAQTLNYLKCSGCKAGLILNFARLKLEIKRVIF
jgi:GxxExxY protein